MKIESISIKMAYQSPTNPRGKDAFSGTEFEDLVASIKEKGILVPLIVRKRSKGGGYEVVAGNRRLAAATKAGLKEIPVVDMQGLSDDEAKEVQIIENLQRKG